MKELKIIELYFETIIKPLERKIKFYIQKINFLN